MALALPVSKPSPVVPIYSPDDDSLRFTISSMSFSSTVLVGAKVAGAGTTRALDPNTEDNFDSALPLDLSTAPLLDIDAAATVDAYASASTC